MLKDYLGPAAVHKEKAEQAIKEGRYDDAWRHLNEQKINYYSHAKQFNFTEKQTLGLDAIVHISMGNLLRKEGKYIQALYHIAYVYKVGKLENPTNDTNDNRLRIYYKRAVKDNGYLNFKEGLDLLPSYDYQSVQHFSNSLLNGDTNISEPPQPKPTVNAEEINKRFFEAQARKNTDQLEGIPPPLKTYTTKAIKKQPVNTEVNSNISNASRTKDNLVFSPFEWIISCLIGAIVLGVFIWLVS